VISDGLVPPENVDSSTRVSSISPAGGGAMRMAPVQSQQPYPGARAPVGNTQGQIDYLDGITVDNGDWWFNVRKSNTESVLRLNMECKTPELLAEKLTELKGYLGEPLAETPAL
jgi:phosphomannomutase